MADPRIVTVKLPEEVYQEMALRIPEGDRSDFIREAINEKLQKTPKADKLLALEERMGKIEEQFGQIKKYLADLDILTFQHGKINPFQFAIDELDRKIIEYLMNYKSATTPELADYLKTNRWLILNRLQKNREELQKTSWQIHHRILCRRKVGQEEGLVDRRRINPRISWVSFKSINAVLFGVVGS